MKKNKLKGAKTTTDNTKYICVSQYGKNANEIEAYSVILIDSNNSSYIDGSYLLAEDYPNQIGFLKSLSETIINFLANHNCRIIKDLRIHPVEYDANSIFQYTALNANYYKKAIAEASLREIEKRDLSKALLTQISCTNPKIKIDQKAYREALLNSFFDKKYPFAKSLITEII